MRKISREDVKDIAEYERMRDAFRRHIIQLKSKRRVGLGPYITLVFENRDTVLFQIEEMMRVERIVQEAKIEHELEIYNSLIPDANELRCTLFIEITEPGDIQPVLDSFMGIDRGRTLWLEFGDERVDALFEQGRSSDEKISAVHFVTFPFTPEQSRRFRSREDDAFLVVDHREYRHRQRLSPDLLASLVEDLES